jgi:hypothetical protein
VPTNGGRPIGRPRGRDDLRVLTVFAAGLALSLLLVARTQVGGDQLNLLGRGWLLVARGQWVPFGNPASTGGAVPGGLTALLVGGPLELWANHRAPLLGILLTQIAAFLLLDGWLRDAVGRRERLLFAVLYWLNPWRLLLSSFLWNPGYLLAIGALHLWCCFRQRATQRFGASLVLALALGLGVQIHPSVVLLGAATVGLLLAGRLRLRWSGVAAGGAIAALPLLPWIAAVRDDPEMLPVSEGFVGRGLLLLFPLRGASYWLRYPSFHLPAKETRFDFTALLEPGVASLPRWLGDVLVKGIGPASVAVALAANVWLWRRWRRRGWKSLLGIGAPGGAPRGWLLSYLRIAFLSSLVVYALAPTTVMWWQPVPLLHSAVLTVTLAAGALARRRRRLVTIAASAWAATAVGLALLVAFGGPRHRCGGRSNIVIPLRHDHAMLHELGIHDSCRVPIQPDGWWPDVLPEPQHRPLGAPEHGAGGG